MRLVCMFEACWELGVRLLLTRHSIKDINTHCLDEFKAHADCLENNNHYQFECRKPEMSLNKCVFDKLVQIPTLRSYL